MNAVTTSLPGVLILEPKVWPDDRGVFYEAWERDRYRSLGLPESWRQDNAVESRYGVLRGLHFQQPNAQHKLVFCLLGEIFDVAVDVRRDSPTFGRWEGVRLSADNRRQLSVPPGFAHGYQVLSERAVVMYKCSTRYDPAAERSLRWDDPTVGIDWPLEPTAMAQKDREAMLLTDYDPDQLPSLG